MIGFGMDLVFHGLSWIESFATRAAVKIRRPRAVSFRFEKSIPL